MLTIQTQSSENGPTELSQLLQFILLPLHLLFQLPDPVALNFDLRLRTDAILFVRLLLLLVHLSDEVGLLGCGTPDFFLLLLLNVILGTAGAARLLTHLIDDSARYLHGEGQGVLTCHDTFHLRCQMIGSATLLASSCYCSVR